MKLKRILPVCVACIIIQSPSASSSLVRPDLPLVLPERSSAAGFLYSFPGSQSKILPPVPTSAQGRVVQAVVSRSMPGEEESLLLTDDGRVYSAFLQYSRVVEKALPPRLEDVVLIAATASMAQKAALRSNGDVVLWQGDSERFDIIEPNGDPLSEIVDLRFIGEYELWTLNRHGRIRLHNTSGEEELGIPQVLAEGVVQFIAYGGGGIAFLRQDGKVVDQNGEFLVYGNYVWDEQSEDWLLEGDLSEDAQVNRLVTDGYQLYGLRGDGSVVAWTDWWFHEGGFVDESKQGAIQIIQGAALFADGSVRLWDPWGLTEGFLNVPEGLSDLSSIGSVGDVSSSFKMWGLKSTGQLVVWTLNRGENSLEIIDVAMELSVPKIRNVVAVSEPWNSFEQQFVVSGDPSPLLGFPLQVLAKLVAEEILDHENNYGLASRPFLLGAVADYLGPAKEEGRLEVQSSPQQFGLYSQDDYDQGVAGGRNEVLADPSAFELYSLDSIMELNLGGVMLQKEGESATLYLQLQTTPSLSEPFVDAEEPIPLSVDLPGTKGFLRVRALGSH